MARKIDTHLPVKRIKYPGARGRPVKPVTPVGIGRSYTNSEQEVLTGSVNEKKASAGEERWAKTLERNGISFEFRMALGAPRNMPGWFELDFLFPYRGLYYAIEVDSAFTHRNKEYKDVLHDAMIIKELEYLGLFPRVIHLDNEQDLSTQSISDGSFRRFFA